MKKNKVLIECSFGRSFGDNPKAIFEKMKEDNKYKFVFVYDKNCKHMFPNEYKLVYRRSMKYMYHHSTSRLWISNVRKPAFLRKRKNQFYLQTWHSPLSLKKIEKDIIAEYGISNFKNSINDGNMTDLMICGNDFRKKVYESSFWFNGPVLKIGTPRCDVFFDEKTKAICKRRIFEMYNLDPSKDLVLYAPTFRSYSKKYLELIDFEKISKKFNCIYRFHYNDIFRTKKDYKNAIDATKYPDMQDLLLACDYLITDYSSSMFDALIGKKKCILFIPDVDEYIKEERNLYFDINCLPFEKTYNLDELENALFNFNNNEYMKKIDEFSKEIGMFEDGHACERISKILNRIMDDNLTIQECLSTSFVGEKYDSKK